MPDEGELQRFLESVTPEKRRRDAARLVELMARATGEEPGFEGTAVGFGRYHYRYASGREGDAAAAGFSAQKATTVVYLIDGVGRHEERLARLGPHTAGVGSIRIRDLDAVDTSVLEEIVRDSYRTLTRETYTLRARDGR